MILTDVRYEKYTPLFDLHTHSVQSGHGTNDTVSDLCKAAKDKELTLLGISEHGPGTLNSGSESFFRSLKLSPRRRCGQDLLLGVELNILNPGGDVDLPDEVISSLDYAIISQHILNYAPGSSEDNTNAYINAMRHPCVHFIGHPDDDVYPLDRERLLYEAKAHNVYPEINNASLKPLSYREGGQKNCREILTICKKLNLPVLMSSDSHGKDNVGNFENIYPLLLELDFPAGLVINTSLEMLRAILKENH